MTKNFCDYCKKEVKSEKSMSISIWGFIDPKKMYRNMCFCENCSLMFDNYVGKFFSNRLGKSRKGKVAVA